MQHHSRYVRPAFALLGLLLGLTACEVEFSPNAEWKEVPLVYCVLDQDDDTAWVRVEKCFLGEGSMYDYGQVSDSFNYPQGSITVTLYAHRDGVCVDTLPCQYTERDRREGNFAHRAQPLYFCPTPRTPAPRLDTTCMYSLVVRRAADGSVLASTDPIALVRQSSDKLIRKPANNELFRFSGRQGSTATFDMEWDQMANGRRYQPVVRFYYGVHGDTHYVDLPCNTVAAGNSSGTLSGHYSRDAFLNELRARLAVDTARKTYLKKVDLYLTACNEDLNAYLGSVGNGGVQQTGDVYTNIHNGIGVFGSRLTHRYKSLRADSNLVPETGLYWYLLRDSAMGFVAQ